MQRVIYQKGKVKCHEAWFKISVDQRFSRMRWRVI